MKVDINSPLCAIRVYRENGLFFFEPYQTFEDHEEMDVFHDQLEETGSPEGELIVCMGAPWPKIKDFYASMYLLLEYDLGDNNPDNYMIVDCFRSVDNVVKHLVQQVFGIFVCDESDFDSFREGNPVYAGMASAVTVPLKEKDDTCSTMYRWASASPSSSW